MKKLLAALICLLLLFTFVACESDTTTSQSNSSSTFVPPVTDFNIPSLEETLKDFPAIIDKEPATEPAEDIGYIVYVSRYGKIHTNPNCSGMQYYTVMGYNQAIAKGYSRCQNCY